jgi:hypothetical protein
MVVPFMLLIVGELSGRLPDSFSQCVFGEIELNGQDAKKLGVGADSTGGCNTLESA